MCVGQSDLSRDSLKRIEAARPDVVLLEIEAQDRRVNRILTRLNDTIPATRIIVLSPTSNKQFVMRLLRHGVDGFLSGPEIETELKRAITVVTQGEAFLCPTASGALVTEYRRHSRRRTMPTAINHAPTQNHTEKGK